MMSPSGQPRPQFVNPIIAARCAQDDGTSAFHFSPLSGEDGAYSSDFESSDGEGGVGYVSSADEEEFQGSRMFLLEHHLYFLA